MKPIKFECDERLETSGKVSDIYTKDWQYCFRRTYTEYKCFIRTDIITRFVLEELKERVDTL